MNRKRSKTRKTKRKQNKRRGRSRRTRYKKKGGLSHGFGKVPVWRRNKAANTYRSEKRVCAEDYGYNPNLPRWWQSLSEQEMKDYEKCKMGELEQYNFEVKNQHCGANCKVVDIAQMDESASAEAKRYNDDIGFDYVIAGRD